MKMSKKPHFVAATLGLVAASSAFAAGSIANTTIKEIYAIDSRNSIGVTVFGDVTNSSCSASNMQNQFYIGYANAGTDHMARIALAAFLAGKQVTISGKGTCWSTSYEYIDELNIH